MRDRLVNSIVIKVQLLAVRKFGDSQKTSELIRALTTELKQSSISEFKVIEHKYLNMVS